VVSRRSWDDLLNHRRLVATSSTTDCLVVEEARWRRWFLRRSRSDRLEGLETTVRFRISSHVISAGGRPARAAAEEKRPP
jgi:hypothetical protein